MNPEHKYSSYSMDYLNRDDRRKKGQRSGFKILATLPKKNKK